MEKRIILLFALFSIILTSGCTSTNVAPSGVTLALRADPSPVFSGSTTSVYLDLDNKDDKTIDNVKLEVFDAGLFGGNPCGKLFARMLPYEFQTIQCNFVAPVLREPAQTEINALASFGATLSGIQPFEIITQAEYQRRLNTQSYVQAPQKYSFRDRNALIEMEFSEPPPIILAPGKKYFVYFTVTNAGNGFIKQVDDSNFLISGQGLLNCAQHGILEPDGKTFPRIACQITVPDSLIAGKSFVSSQIGMDFRYNYELREKLPVNIIK